MRISSITASNFRCFGPKATKISLSNLTGLIGTNGCGKSAALHALARLFGMTTDERTLERADFHTPIGKTLEEIGACDVMIEVRLDFPELMGMASDEHGEAVHDVAIADCFHHMVVEDEGEPPYCRVRLVGRWTPSSLPEGDIEQQIYWVTSAGDPGGEDLHTMRAADRSRIQVLYVPAARDPARQIRQAPGATLHQLLRAIRWSKKVVDDIEASSEQLAQQFGAESGVKAIETAIKGHWRSLHPGSAFSDIAVRPTAKSFGELLKRVEPIFSPGPGGGDLPVDRLSDGLKSLFYLALVTANFDIMAYANSVKSSSGNDQAWDVDALDPPLLTVFAIEEPENHLAPHYLGRIMSILRRVANTEYGQVLLTSHSASIMSRVEPEEVRYLRLDDKQEKTLVSEIVLPDDQDEAYKYVREAVKAYPELYFARLVVLGEGDSEEIIIPRLSIAEGLPVDQSFVSVVPLGGRHVNHFWRLLHSLHIPHVTLLDFDLGREGGGWGRIKYACDQLIQNGVKRRELLKLSDDSVLSSEAFEAMPTWQVDTGIMRSWLNTLEGYGVFFSRWLDLDFMMLKAFEQAYCATAVRGPNIPKDTSKLSAAVDKATQAVLGEGSSAIGYSEADQRLFIWYRYLFLNRSKPTSHLMALTFIWDEDLVASAPKVLLRLIKRIKTGLQSAAEDEGDAG
jgi:putative ATP-dependent endonuclease of the OLD family